MTTPDLDELVARVREATSAFIGGDMQRYFELVDHADDFTLMGPFGGETRRESEQQHGEVGGRPPQDWSLRVTLVFRREGSRWRLVHRHADALVHPITFDQLAQLARGTAPT